MSDRDEDIEALDPALRLSDLTPLVTAGTLPSSNYLAACLAVREHEFWQRWAGYALLALGAGHLLAGVIYFFAFNWAALSAFTKFAIVEAALVLAVAAWWRLGRDSLAGQAAAIAATVLLGVLMAVFGQIYQTGADAYELFLNWAALSLPFVLAARSWPHWLLWLLLANTAGISFLMQAPEAPEVSASSFACGFTLANLVFLSFVEALRAKFSAPAWFRYSLICAVLVITVTTGGIGMNDDPPEIIEISWRWLAIALAIMIIVTGYLKSRFWTPDFALLGLCTFSAITLVFIAIVTVSFHILNFGDFALYGVLGLTAPGLVGLGALHLRRQWAASGRRQ